MPGRQSTVPWTPCGFVDRSSELEALDRAFSERPGFVVVYGRRRIGKTRLLLEWARSRGVKLVYYLAHLSSHGHNLRLFAERAAAQLGDTLIARVSHESLSSLLELIARSGAEAVIIDEFTYWVRASPRVLSELQEFVDLKLGSTGLLLVVSGSLIGVMERAVLSGGSPLYARAKARIRLGELEFPCLKTFTPSLTPADRVRLYALIGGIPFYLCLVAGSKTLEEVVEKLILQPGAPLREEKDLLLREELRDPHAYNAILSALAKGYDTPARIAAIAGLDPSHTHKYLSVLEHLGFVERRAPLFKRKGRYVIVDPILRTWYGLIEPVLEALEAGALDAARKAIAARIDQHSAPVWEELVRRHLLKQYSAEGFTLAGCLEHKGEELDVVVLNPEERRAVVCEAKWSSLTLREAEMLREKARAKALKLLPHSYHVEEVYVAARSVEGGEGEAWILTPEKIESTPCR